MGKRRKRRDDVSAEVNAQTAVSLPRKEFLGGNMVSVAMFGGE